MSLINASSELSTCSLVSFRSGMTATAGRSSCDQRWMTGAFSSAFMFSRSMRSRSRLSRPVLIASVSRPSTSVPRTAFGPQPTAAAATAQKTKLRSSFMGFASLDENRHRIM
jgi:hypothetical protein